MPDPLKEQLADRLAALQVAKTACESFLNALKHAIEVHSDDNAAAVDDAYDALSDAMDTVQDITITYPSITVNSVAYDVLTPEINLDGEIVTAEDVDDDSDLQEQLVEAGSKMVMIKKPVADFISDDQTVAPAAEVEFTDQSTNAPTSWLWDFGDGETSTEQNPTHAYAEEGSYTVVMTATNARGSHTKTRNNYIVVDTP